MKRAYENGDIKALTEALEFGAAFRALDARSRAYGNLIYSAFLDLTETKTDTFTRALLASTPAARQRTRDLLFYPISRVKKSDRPTAEAEFRAAFPLIFPADYRFGTNGELFGAKN